MAASTSPLEACFDRTDPVETFALSEGSDGGGAAQAVGVADIEALAGGDAALGAERPVALAIGDGPAGVVLDEVGSDRGSGEEVWGCGEGGGLAEVVDGATSGEDEDAAGWARRSGGGDSEGEAAAVTRGVRGGAPATVSGPFRKASHPPAANATP